MNKHNEESNIMSSERNQIGNSSVKLVLAILCLITLSFISLKAQKIVSTEFPPITPAWALEPWIWEDNGNTKGSIMEVANGYRHHNIPFGVILIDSPWQTGYNTFDWDTLRYPDPQQFINDLHAQEVKVVIWLTAFFNRTARLVLEPRHPKYDWLIEKEYVVDNGEDNEWWMGKGVHLDFTNPEAVFWWHTQLDKVIDMGIDGFKTDGGANNLGDSVITSKGIFSREDYRKLYYADVFDYLRTKNPEGIILARPYSHQGGFASSVSKCPVGWCGDFFGNWEGLQLQMDNIYTSAQSGYGILACEVGGYVSRSRSNKEQLIRYTQFGALLPAMINGGNNGGLSNHLPWFHDDETVSIYRYYATLHSELVPYIFSLGIQSHLKGTPLVRSSDISKAQHLLGSELFVSPVVTNDLFKNITFPEENYWIDFWDEEIVYKPGSSLLYSAALEKFPLFIKAGGIIPLNVKNSITQHGDIFSEGKPTIVIYPYKKSKAEFNLPEDGGVEYYPLSLTLSENDGKIKITSQLEKEYILRIKSFNRPVGVSGCNSWKYDEEKKLIIIECKGKNIQIEINGLVGYSSIIDEKQISE